MDYTAQNNYRERLFYRSCLESAPRPVPSHRDICARAMGPGGRMQFQLHQIKRKLLGIALEEAAAEVGLFKQICGAANQAAELAWNESCPLLVYPCLFEELVQAAREQFQQEQAWQMDELALMREG